MVRSPLRFVTTSQAALSTFSSARSANFDFRMTTSESGAVHRRVPSQETLRLSDLIGAKTDRFTDSSLSAAPWVFEQLCPGVHQAGTAAAARACGWACKRAGRCWRSPPDSGAMADSPTSTGRLASQADAVRRLASKNQGRPPAC